MTNHFRKRAASDRSQEAMSLVPFFLSNSGKKKPFGALCWGLGWGWRCWRLPGGAVRGWGWQHLSVWTLPMVAVPPSLSLPSLPGPGQALPPLQFLPRLGDADNNEELAIYLPTSFRLQRLPASPRPQPAPGCSLW